MAKRKQFITTSEIDIELRSALSLDKKRGVSEEELAAQRISFAYGNAGEDSRVTKASIKSAASRSRLSA